MILLYFDVHAVGGYWYRPALDGLFWKALNHPVQVTSRAGPPLTV